MALLPTDEPQERSPTLDPVLARDVRALVRRHGGTSGIYVLDRFLGTGPIVMHKAAWLPSARHDNGIIAFGGGAYVATVLTWRTGAADELAGRISLAALKRFRAVG